MNAASKLSMLEQLGLGSIQKIRKIETVKREKLEAFTSRYKEALLRSRDYVKNEQRKFGGSFLPGRGVSSDKKEK